MTTWEYIATNYLREGIDYEITEISSIQESAETGLVAPRPYKPQTFKNVRRAHKITRREPLVSERYVMALSNMISTDMKALRRMYKTARAQAERDQDSDTEAPCDTQQLSVKIENNAMYGVLLYLQASVGGATTTSARNAIRSVAERTSADTDSLFLNVLSPTAVISVLYDAWCRNAQRE